ncbi:MAG: sugar MFS transporter [Sphingomonas sp.]|nr:sugar MFS transporter [Sphingomonas sp.]
MALAPSAPADVTGEGVNAPDLQIFVFALFFIFGGITSLNDVIIPKLKDLFTLNYFQALLVQSAFFAAYFIFSIPAAAIVRKAGYMRSASIGLVIMTAGCLLFIPASQSGTFAVFLFALFVLAAGITTVQVVANPLISLLGKPATTSSRLTFAQAFNSLGTTIFPIVGGYLILGSLAKVDPKTLSGAALDAYRTAETQVVVNTYLALALALVIVAGVVWTRRNRLPNVVEDSGSVLRAFNLLGRPRFGFGAACIFLYVGAEVAIGSLIVNYLIQADVFAIGAVAASTYVGFYWGGAMFGRFIGTVVLRFVSPGLVLAAVATGSITLILVTASTTGQIAGWSMLAIGLMNAIMFPTIFSLASEGLGKRAAEGSGIIAMAIVGGAVIPPLTGLIADASTLRFALILPAACYAVIAAYGIYARRPAIG